tara:strand:+ start:426 stop:713 length:288 start_codon:yes stop_codon:yes gene_type:complete
MTEKEMRKLTDMILDGITSRQNELDEEFFRRCDTQNFNVINFNDREDKSQREIYLEKIKDLQAELLLQLSKENYEIADTLKKTIDELKRRLNEEL